MKKTMDARRAKAANAAIVILVLRLYERGRSMTVVLSSLSEAAAGGESQIILQ